jgi:EKC/KEOPS complex subunit CGI121/TPRKB
VWHWVIGWSVHHGFFCTLSCTNAQQILSPTHLLSTTFLAIHALQTHHQKTRTPHSELVFRLSPNNNIGESYKKFGLSDTTTTLIAVKLPLKSAGDGKDWVLDESITNESVSEHLGKVVEGTSVPVGENGEELGEACDVEKVRKVYKIGGEGAGKKGKKGAAVNGDGEEKKAEERRVMESVILGTIALKGT